MGPPRVPTARQVFPILARFQNLRPRRFNATPVGFEPPRGAVDADQLFNGLRHLYHDLGVLVFAGCSRRRVARIAAILRRVVQGGGPLSLSLRLGEDRDSARTHFERTEVLRETECFVGAADGLLPVGDQHYQFFAATGKRADMDGRYLGWECRYPWSAAHCN